MLWLSSEKCGCTLLSNRHPLPRLICFFVLLRGQFSASFSIISEWFMRLLPRSPHTVHFILTAPLTNMEHLGFFKRWKWLEKPRMTLSLARLRGSYHKSGCRVIGLRSGLGLPHRENTVWSVWVRFHPPVLGAEKQTVKPRNEIYLK